MAWLVAVLLAALGSAMIYAGINNNPGGFIGAFTGAAPTHDPNSVGAKGSSTTTAPGTTGGGYGGGDFGPGSSPNTGSGSQGGSW